MAVKGRDAWRAGIYLALGLASFSQQPAQSWHEILPGGGQSEPVYVTMATSFPGYLRGGVLRERSKSSWRNVWTRIWAGREARLWGQPLCKTLGLDTWRDRATGKHRPQMSSTLVPQGSVYLGAGSMMAPIPVDIHPPWLASKSETCRQGLVWGPTPTLWGVFPETEGGFARTFPWNPTLRLH